MKLDLEHAELMFCKVTQGIQTRLTSKLRLVPFQNSSCPCTIQAVNRGAKHAGSHFSAMGILNKLGRGTGRGTRGGSESL